MHRILFTLVLCLASCAHQPVKTFDPSKPVTIHRNLTTVEITQDHYFIEEMSFLKGAKAEESKAKALGLKRATQVLVGLTALSFLTLASGVLPESDLQTYGSIGVALIGMGTVYFYYKTVEDLGKEHNSSLGRETGQFGRTPVFGLGGSF